MFRGRVVNLVRGKVVNLSAFSNTELSEKSLLEVYNKYTNAGLSYAFEKFSSKFKDKTIGSIISGLNDELLLKLNN